MKKNIIFIFSLLLSINTYAFAFNASGITEPQLVDATYGTYRLQDDIYSIYNHVAVCVWEKNEPHAYRGTFNIWTNSYTTYFSVVSLETPSVDSKPNTEYVFRIGNGWCNPSEPYSSAFMNGFANFYGSVLSDGTYSQYPLPVAPTENKHISGTIWAFSIIIVLMLKVMAYFLLLYIIGLMVGFGIVKFIRPIIQFIQK